ncbi:MAG TPA: site-specific integrase [Pyrinomonadaceae bacterium]
MAADKDNPAKGNRGLKTGSIFKRVDRDERGRISRTYYVVRRRYTDASGTAREKKRIADTYADAQMADREIKAEIARALSAPAEPEPERTFAELAARYKQEYMIPPRYIAGKKVEGLRSHKKLLPFFNTLVARFGRSPLKEISYQQLREFKRERLGAPVTIRRRDRRTGREWAEARQRSVAAVDRELQLLRRMLNVAVHLGWIASNPFRAGDPLINTAHETKRMRVLSHDEEPLLLAACGERELSYARGGRFKGKIVTARDQSEKRAHLRPAIICALDTALRENEQFTLTRADVHLDERVITVREFNAKVERERLVPITARLHAELSAIFARLPEEPTALVFPQRDLKKSFAGACAAAGITDLRWHDLRHTAIMWMLEAGMPESEVMKVTGHSNYTTFMRYVSLNRDRTRRAAEMLDARRARVEAEAKERESREPVH